MPVLSCKEVVKKYSRNGFCLNVDEFSVTHKETRILLGPNGSGKTTFLKIITDLKQEDSGEILISGIPKSEKEARQHIAFLPEDFLFPANFTGRQVLFYYSSITRTDYGLLKKEIERVAGTFNIDYLDKRIKNCSKGMKQILGLLLTFLGPHKQLYILDEPFNGLDAVQKERALIFIQNLREKAQSSILITTHVQSDIEKIADRVTLVKDGVLSETLTREEIYSRFSSIEEFYLDRFRDKPLSI